MFVYSETEKSEKLFSFYNKLPQIIKVSAIKSLCRLTNFLVNRQTTPTAVTFFVTYKCFARCKHCFLLKDINKNLDNELTIGEIKKIFMSSRHQLTRVLLMGGESFLREDIAEIYKLIYEINKPVKFWVATSGLYPERIESAVKEILSGINGTPYVVAVSLQGSKEVQDNITGIKGGFEKTLETIDRLKRIKKQHPNLNVRISTTIFSTNLEGMEKFIDFVKDDLELTQLLNFVWGSDITCFSVSPDLVTNFSPTDKALLPSLETIQAINSAINNKLQNNRLLSKIEVLKRQYAIDILKNKKRPFTCMAPKINAVIYPNGEVSFCEFITPVGNLRDFNFNLFKLWQSEKANYLRSQLTDCACTLPCSYISTSLSYDEKALLQLL